MIASSAAALTDVVPLTVLPAVGLVIFAVMPFEQAFSQAQMLSTTWNTVAPAPASRAWMRSTAVAPSMAMPIEASNPTRAATGARTPP